MNYISKSIYNYSSSANFEKFSNIPNIDNFDYIGKERTTNVNYLISRIKQKKKIFYTYNNKYKNKLYSKTELYKITNIIKSCNYNIMAASDLFEDYSYNELKHVKQKYCIKKLLKSEFTLEEDMQLIYYLNLYKNNFKVVLNYFKNKNMLNLKSRYMHLYKYKRHLFNDSNINFPKSNSNSKFNKNDNNLNSDIIYNNVISEKTEQLIKDLNCNKNDYNKNSCLNNTDILPINTNLNNLVGESISNTKSTRTSFNINNEFFNNNNITIIDNYNNFFLSNNINNNTTNFFNYNSLK